MSGAWERTDDAALSRAMVAMVRSSLVEVGIDPLTVKPSLSYGAVLDWDRLPADPDERAMLLKAAHKALALAHQSACGLGADLVWHLEAWSVHCHCTLGSGQTCSFCGEEA